MNDYIAKNGRKLDYYARLDLPNKTELMIEELKAYQNIDGGFGHGLELDIQAPISTVPATDVAIKYIKQLKPSKALDDMLIGMVKYFESTFYPDEHRWYMVEKEVDDYPRAVWWNYSSRSSFGLLNPTPEILGFLYQQEDKVENVPVKQEIKRMVETIRERLPQSTGFHDVLSVLRFYRDIPYIQKDIYDILYHKTQAFLQDQSEDYHLRAHQVALISDEFVTKQQLEEDLDLLQKELEKKGYIECTWEWYQYPDVFQKVKPQWNAYLTREALEAIEHFYRE